MDLLGGFLPSKGEESNGGSDKCAAGPPTPPYPNDSILLDEDALNESAIYDSDALWMPAADVSMDTVLSVMMGIVSAVEPGGAREGLSSNFASQKDTDCMIVGRRS